MALFGRQKYESETEMEEPVPTPVEPVVRAPRQPVTPPPAPATRQGGVTVVGKGISIKGELFGDEDVKIEGRVEGKIRLAKNLLVGQSV